MSRMSILRRNKLSNTWFLAVFMSEEDHKIRNLAECTRTEERATFVGAVKQRHACKLPSALAAA
ncbi:unnamed protein product [Musa acuminata var. zebrina]